MEMGMIAVPEGRTSVKSILGSQVYLSLQEIVEPKDGREGLKAKLDEEQRRDRWKCLGHFSTI